MPSPDPDVVRALSVRQPYAEQILLGKKKIEYRSRNSNIRERVYLYASKGEVDEPSEWRKAGAKPGTLPTGVIVGTVEIVGSEYDEDEDWYEWKLARPQRLASALTPINQPQPGVWRPQFKAEPAAPPLRPFMVPAEPFANLPPNRPRPSSSRPLRSSSGGSITGDLVCYHNPDKMNTEVWTLDDAGPLSAVCARRYQGAEGKRIWLVTGRDTPRRYYLAGWFLVERIDPVVYDNGLEDFRYMAGNRHLASRFFHMVEIGDQPWFKEFQRACANFATMQHVRDVLLIKHLEAAWARTRAPK